MFAIFRTNPNADLAKISEEHMKKDLKPEDRALLRRAANKVSTHATIGSALGLGLGLAMAMRLRTNRLALYDAFRVVHKPTEIVFANGRTEPIPDISRFIKPSAAWDIATFSLFGLGGTLLGGETGFLTGTASATTAVARSPPEQRERIEDAFRLFQADILKRQLSMVESQVHHKEKIHSNTESWEGESSWDKLKNQAAGMASSLKSG